MRPIWPALSSSLDEREEMVEQLQAHLEIHQDLRQVHIDQNVAPPLYFKPVVPGQRITGERRPFRPSPEPSVGRPTNLEDAAFWPVTHLAALFHTRQVTSVELTRMYLDRLRRYDRELECVVTFTDDLAMEEAARADRELEAGRYRAPCMGSPWGRKTLSPSADTARPGARKPTVTRCWNTMPPSCSGCPMRGRCSS